MKEETKLKKALLSLTDSITVFEIKLDDEMKNPSTFERGTRIAKLINGLSIERDRILHGTLNLSFEKMGKRYKQIEKAVK